MHQTVSIKRWGRARNYRQEGLISCESQGFVLGSRRVIMSICSVLTNFCTSKIVLDWNRVLVLGHSWIFEQNRVARASVTLNERCDVALVEIQIWCWDPSNTTYIKVFAVVTRQIAAVSSSTKTPEIEQGTRSLCQKGSVELQYYVRRQNNMVSLANAFLTCISHGHRPIPDGSHQLRGWRHRPHIPCVKTLFTLEVPEVR